MADSTLQITPGAGGVYARVLQSLTVDGHATLIPYHMSLDGGPGWVAIQTYTTSTDMTTATAITAAPTSGQKIVIDDILVSTAVAMEFTLQEETSATVFSSFFLPTNGTVFLPFRSKLKLATADKKLFGKASVAGNVRITCFYHSEV